MGTPVQKNECRVSQTFVTPEELDILTGQGQSVATPPGCESGDVSRYVQAEGRQILSPSSKPSADPDTDQANLLLDSLYKEVYEWDSPSAELFIAHLRGAEFSIELSPKTAITKLQNIEKMLALAKRFDALPKEIKDSGLGQAVLLEIETLVGLISDGIDDSEIAAASAHVDALKRYQRYEEEVRRPAQERLKGYYPGYQPTGSLDFEYNLKQRYRDAFDYEMLDNLPICRAFKTLSHDDRMQLFMVVSAFRSSGYNEDNLMENPLSGTDIDGLGAWIEARETVLKGEAFARLLGKADEISGAEARENGFTEGARLRLEVEKGKQLVTELGLIRNNFGNLDDSGQAALRALLLDELREIKKEGEAREAKIKNDTTSPTDTNIQRLCLGGQEAKPEELFHIEPIDMPNQYTLWLDTAIANLESGRPLSEREFIVAEKLIAGSVQDDAHELSMSAGVSRDVADEINGIEIPTEGNLNEERFIKQADRALEAIDAASLQEGIVEAKKNIESMLASEDNIIGITDFEENGIKNDLRQLSRGYDKALRLLANGDYAGAKREYLSLYESYHQKAVFKLFGEYQEESARNKFAIKMGIITASAFLGGLTATALLGEAATAATAGQMAGLRLLVESGAFLGSEKLLNYAILNERLYDPEKGFLGNAADYGVEYLETVGMFGITRWAHVKYEGSVGEWMFKSAERRLINAGKLAEGLAKTSSAARAMVVAEMRSGWSGILWNSLYKVGAFGTEYTAFKGYEFLQAATEDIAGIREGDPMAVFSGEMMGETLRTLVCLKLGGFLARPITVPITNKTAEILLSRHKPALDALEVEVKSAHQELLDYLKSGEKDPKRLESIERRLKDCLTKRQRLVQTLVSVGISTPDILTRTNAALAEASRAPREAKVLDEVLARVETKNETTWEYDPIDEGYISDRLAELTKETPERLMQENGTYLLELSDGKRLTIKQKEANPDPDPVSRGEKTKSPAEGQRPERPATTGWMQSAARYLKWAVTLPAYMLVGAGGIGAPPPLPSREAYMPVRRNESGNGYRITDDGILIDPVVCGEDGILDVVLKAQEIVERKNGHGKKIRFVVNDSGALSQGKLSEFIASLTGLLPSANGTHPIQFEVSVVKNGSAGREANVVYRYDFDGQRRVEVEPNGRLDVQENGQDVVGTVYVKAADVGTQEGIDAVAGRIGESKASEEIRVVIEKGIDKETAEDVIVAACVDTKGKRVVVIDGDGKVVLEKDKDNVISRTLLSNGDVTVVKKSLPNGKAGYVVSDKKGNVILEADGAAMTIKADLSAKDESPAVAALSLVLKEAGSAGKRELVVKTGQKQGRVTGLKELITSSLGNNGDLRSVTEVSTAKGVEVQTRYTIDGAGKLSVTGQMTQTARDVTLEYFGTRLKNVGTNLTNGQIDELLGDAMDQAVSDKHDTSFVTGDWFKMWDKAVDGLIKYNNIATGTSGMPSVDGVYAIFADCSSNGHMRQANSLDFLKAMGMLSPTQIQKVFMQVISMAAPTPHKVQIKGALVDAPFRAELYGTDKDGLAARYEIDKKKKIKAELEKNIASGKVNNAEVVSLPTADRSGLGLSPDTLVSVGINGVLMEIKHTSSKNLQPVMDLVEKAVRQIQDNNLTSEIKSMTSGKKIVGRVVVIRLSGITLGSKEAGEIVRSVQDGITSDTNITVYLEFDGGARAVDISNKASSSRPISVPVEEDITVRFLKVNP